MMKSKAGIKVKFKGCNLIPMTRKTTLRLHF